MTTNPHPSPLTDPAIVEAAARAMCVDKGIDPDAQEILIECGFITGRGAAWKAYRQDMKAALTAVAKELEARRLRIVPVMPTPEMVGAGGAAVCEERNHDDWPCCRRHTHGDYDDMLALKSYLAMIAAANGGRDE